MRIVLPLLVLSSLTGGCTDVLSPRHPSGTANPPETGNDFLRFRYRARDHVVPLHTLELTTHGPYRRPIVFVARSASEWQAFHTHAIQEGGMFAGPAPAPPDVDFAHGEAVLLVGMTGPDASYPVRILGIGRHGERLRSNIQIDWSWSLDRLEYAPVHMVKFQGWSGLNSQYAIGPDDVLAALRELAGS